LKIQVVQDTYEAVRFGMTGYEVWYRQLETEHAVGGCLCILLAAQRCETSFQMSLLVERNSVQSKRDDELELAAAVGRLAPQ
jgi:hypothetical protein